MGNASVNFVPHLTAHIQTNTGAIFRLFYPDLVDHILLLRQVIAHPEMIEKGEKLNSFVHDYCHRMSKNEMMSKRRQLELPWQIDWIWHVHRLHPINYLNDCIQQVPGGYFIDKKTRKLTIDEYQNQNFVSSKEPVPSRASFVPSLDLVQAVLRQRDFLEKFQKHQFYSMQFKSMNSISFQQLVQNYISFMKLARENVMIVPTFDIDLMWHTHMRSPMSYLEFSTAICGFILNHDDSIAKDSLIAAYQDTAARWKLTYQSDYGQNIDQNHLRNTSYRSSCAMVKMHDKEKRLDQQSSGSCGGCYGGWWASTDADSDSGGSDSSCGGGCGGD